MGRSVQSGRGSSLIRGALVTAAGGLTSALAFEPWGQGWLAPVGVALLVWPVFGVASDTTRPSALSVAAALGAVHGGVGSGLLLWWLWGSIAPAAWVALVAVHAGWGAVLGLGAVAVAALPGRLVWVASVWTAVELARSSWPFGGLPWGRLGHAALDTPWQELLGCIGVTGTSWVTALVGGAVALVVTARGARAPALVIGAVVLLVPAIPSNAVGDRVARVAVVQPGVPGDGTDLGAHHRQVTERLRVETRRLARRDAKDASAPPDLILWPENATAVDPYEDSVSAAAIRAAVQVSGVPILVGSVLEGPRAGTLANTSVAWRPDGTGGVSEAGRYAKQNLVPFGEYVPLRALAERVSSRVTEVKSDMVPGGRASPLRVGGVRLAVALCFDVAYRDPLVSQVRQGADLVAVQTSNATFTGTTQPDQQWAITRVRAIELGRSVVVSSTTGVSGAIGPDGSVLHRLAPGGPAGAVLELPLQTALTPAVSLGRWIELLAALLAGVGPLAAVLRAGAARVRAGRKGRAGPAAEAPPVCGDDEGAGSL